MVTLVPLSISMTRVSLARDMIFPCRPPTVTMLSPALSAAMYSFCFLRRFC